LELFFVIKGTFLKLIQKELALKILMRIYLTHFPFSKGEERLVRIPNAAFYFF